MCVCVSVCGCECECECECVCVVGGGNMLRKGLFLFVRAAAEVRAV